MLTKSELQDVFVAGVREKLLLLGFGRGGQKRIANAAGISASYFCDILAKRKLGTEDRRRRIAQALGTSYEEILTLGRKTSNEETIPAIRQCHQYDRFTEDRAVCIYRCAAEEAGIHGSYFLRDESFKRIRPPGWIEYLNKEIGDGELYDFACSEMKTLQRISQK